MHGFGNNCPISHIIRVFIRVGPSAQAMIRHGPRALARPPADDRDDLSRI
jgi:hypothetical protein